MNSAGIEPASVRERRLTDYQAKCFAHKLQRSYANDHLGKLAGLLFDAQFETKPHQIDAALFALQTLFLPGVILADEVDLGNTIEAGIVISQYWAERKRRILITAPSSLRQQWKQELHKKFMVQSELLNSKSRDRLLQVQDTQKAQVMICSYEFVLRNEATLSRHWDFMVADEAHRLRNFWNGDRAKTPSAVSRVVRNVNKTVLLTATPLQNRLDKLYGLVSIFDPNYFQSLEAFSERYVKNREDFGDDDLVERVATISKRTLRRDADKYIRFTNRSAITVEFTPSEEEIHLYDLVNDYLQREQLSACAGSQRHLSALIIRKRLGPSTYAVAGMLENIASRLEEELTVRMRRSGSGMLVLDDDLYSEEVEELDNSASAPNDTEDTSLEEHIHAEVKELREYAALARSITVNQKAVKLTFVDSKGEGTTAKDEDAYDLIMKDKVRPLSEDTPTQFIFSHSALHEGWNNPNVFQTCTLREMGGETQRRQMIGRGLRLPVNKHGERIAEPGVAELTVTANESYAEFAKSLQEEYKKAGIQLGFVRKGEFAQVPVVDGETETPLGCEVSAKIYEALKRGGFLDKGGRVTHQFTPNVLGFDLGLPVDFAWATHFVIELVDKCKLDKLVKRMKDRAERQLNKELYWTEEFEDFWYAISRKTTYLVKMSRENLIRQGVDKLRDLDENPRIEPLRIQITKAALKIQRGGAKAEECGVRTADLRGSYDLPDIIIKLKNATKLTRCIIIDILTESGRLDEFIGNPNDFIAMARQVISAELAKIIVDGVEYEKIAGSVYELRELREDSRDESNRFLDQLDKVQHQEKADFDYVLFDSDIERQFAKKLDDREDIKMFMNLPAKFKIDTPVCPYNPDWAIVKHEDGEDRIYRVRETRSTSNAELLRPVERQKIKAAREHLKALDIDYAKSSPGGWNL